MFRDRPTTIRRCGFARINLVPICSRAIRTKEITLVVECNQGEVEVRMADGRSVKSHGERRLARALRHRPLVPALALAVATIFLVACGRSQPQLARIPTKGCAAFDLVITEPRERESHNPPLTFWLEARRPPGTGWRASELRYRPRNVQTDRFSGDAATRGC